MDKKKNKADTLNTLSNGLKILDILYEEGEIGVTELSKILGVNKSNAFRLLNTLKKSAFVEQISDGGKYKLGLKLAKFQSHVLNQYEIRDIIRPYLVKLRDITGEAAGLSIMNGDEAIIIDKCSSSQHVGVNLKIGMIEELNSTAHGKALLYSFPESEQRRLLEKQPLIKHTENTLVDIESIIEDAKINKQRGYAVDYEENEYGMRCIATNIYDYSKKAVAAIGVSCPLERVKDDRLPNLIKQVKDIANEVSKKFGY